MKIEASYHFNIQIMTQNKIQPIIKARTEVSYLTFENNKVNVSLKKDSIYAVPFRYITNHKGYPTYFFNRNFRFIFTSINSIM